MLRVGLEAEGEIRDKQRNAEKAPEINLKILEFHGGSVQIRTGAMKYFFHLCLCNVSGRTNSPLRKLIPRVR